MMRGRRSTAPGCVERACAEQYNRDMTDRPSALATWSPEQVAHGHAWMTTWKRAGLAFEALRNTDAFAAIGMRCGPADGRGATRAPKPTSSLIEQQRLRRPCGAAPGGRRVYINDAEFGLPIDISRRIENPAPFVTGLSE
jgi:hypothetical protein